MKEGKIELKEEQRKMLNFLLRRSKDFTAMGFGDAEYLMIVNICGRGYYFSWDRKLLNNIRKKYIEWFIHLPF